MNPNFPRRYRSAVLLSLTAMALAACLDVTGPALEDSRLSSIISPLGRTFLELEPAGTVELMVGDTVAFRSPQYPASQLNFVLSDSSLASITPTGVLTGLAPGEVRVTVSRKAAVRTASTVTIRIHSRGPASVQLLPLTDSAGVPVRRESVAGIVHPSFLVQQGDAARFEVAVGSVVACTASLSTPTESPPSSSDPNVAEPRGCALDTAAFDSVGSPTFLNGPALLSVRLLRGDGVVLTSAAYPQVVLRNRNTVAARTVAAAEAVDDLGRGWIGGNVSVRAFPVQYEPGLGIGSVGFSYTRPDGMRTLVVDSTAPFSAEFNAVDLQGMIDESFQVEVTTVLTNGQTGPSTVTPPRRYDGIPPVPGTLRDRRWIGAQTSFAALYSPSTAPDEGVGGATARFFAGPISLRWDELPLLGKLVVTGGDLDESREGAYRVGYELCDAVRNCVWSNDGFVFGVDHTPPALSLNLPSRSINPSVDFRPEAVDTLSGLDSMPVEVSVRIRLPGSAAEICGGTIEGRALPGHRSGSSCLAEPVSGGVPTPRNTAGYFLYRTVATDLAGNRSPPTETLVIVDHVAPTIRSFTLPSSLTAGEEAVVVAELTDNLDLDSLEVRLVYPVPGSRHIALPFAPTIRVGSATMGSPPLTLSATERPRIGIVRTLTYFAAASAPRVTVSLDSIQARVTDAARHSAFVSRPVSAGAFGTPVPSEPFAAVSSVVPSTSVARICTARCVPGDATSTTITIRVVGEPGLSALSRMYLMSRGADGIVTQLASTQAFSVSESGTQRVYTYTFTHRPPAGAVDAQTLFGVGVGSNGGNALKTAELSVDRYVR